MKILWSALLHRATIISWRSWLALDPVESLQHSLDTLAGFWWKRGNGRNGGAEWEGRARVRREWQPTKFDGKLTGYPSYLPTNSIRQLKGNWPVDSHAVGW